MLGSESCGAQQRGCRTQTTEDLQRDLALQTTGLKRLVQASGLPGKGLGPKIGMCCTHQQQMTNADWQPCFCLCSDSFGLKQLFLESHASSCLLVVLGDPLRRRTCAEEYIYLCHMWKAWLECRWFQGISMYSINCLVNNIFFSRTLKLKASSFLDLTPTSQEIANMCLRANPVATLKFLPSLETFQNTWRC